MSVIYPMNPEPETFGCECSLNEGRCERHRLMMNAIHTAWNAPGRDPDLIDDLRGLSDGFGVSMLDLGTYDWSGIRDSSPAAVAAMYDRVLRPAPRDRSPR